MNEQEFTALADKELAALELALESCGGDFDMETKPGGILELDFADAGKIIINRHVAAREIWLAARSGGFHFAPQKGQWIASRDGAELWASIERCLTDQAGEALHLVKTD